MKRTILQTTRLAATAALLCLACNDIGTDAQSPMWGGDVDRFLRMGGEPAETPDTLRYTVKYNGNDNTGGAVPVDGGSYRSGTEVTVKNAGTLVREGFTFSGWNTRADGDGTPYGIGESFNIQGNTTLYARWTQVGVQTYMVTVYGGTGGGSYTAEKTVTVTATVPAGQQFTNWKVTSGGVTLADANSAITTFTMPANAVTVTANFERMSGGDGDSIPVTQPQFEPWQAVDVTFYDFRHDRSNPEFEQPHGKYNGSSTYARPGMVTRLDADGKPVAAHPDSGGYLNQGIRFWFRDWSKLNAYKMADSTDPINPGKKYLEKFRPVYTYGNNPPPAIRGNSGDEWYDTSLRWRKNAYVTGDFTDVPAPAGSGLKPVTIDNGNIGISNAFENTVIKGRLWFQHIGNGVYQFSQNKERGSFFPLDNAPSPYTANGRTPGVEFPAGGTVLETVSDRWKSHNYAFTMELVCEFTMQPGFAFEFTGDDDVWVFINKRLAVDVGGIHETVTQRVDLDAARSTLGGLEYGKKYELRMFYAERHSDDSNVKITTNIMAAPSP
jgi:fibro-slime domain-containing protein/uncharacterized repeat protein (TIGR02543 family)